MARYWCKTCQVFVDDNAVSKRHHQDSQRHKTGIQKTISQVHLKNRKESKKRDISEKTDFRIRREDKKIIEKSNQPDEEKHGEASTVEISPWEDVEKENTVQAKEIAPPELEEQSSTRIQRTPKKPVSFAIQETKRWNLDKKKSIQLNDSDDDDDLKTPIVTFKKRKIPNK